MSRKNFARGINAVLEGAVQNERLSVNVNPENTTSVIEEIVVEAAAKEVRQDTGCENVSITNIASITNNHATPSNDELPVTNEIFETSPSHQIRTSIYMKSDLHQQLKAMAYWERCSVTALIHEALEKLINSRGTEYNVKEIIKKHKTLSS